MRKTAAALALVLVATLGIIVPSVAAATGDPKVVIIVGATHGATAGYRADADVAYAEAMQVHPQRRQGLQPERDLGEGQGGGRRARRSSSTWATATAGRARTPTTPKYTTKDGFGLNATAGAGDYNNKYYGEPYMATLDLAPERGRHPQPPVLRLGQLRAGQPRADASPSPASEPTTTRRAS